MVDKKASEIMDREMVAVSPTTTIIASITLVENSNVDLLPVIDNGRLIGIIDEDTLRAFAIRHSGEEMNAPIKPLVKEPLFVEEEESVKDVIVKVVKYNVTRIPVIDSRSSMRCVGVISASDLLRSAGGKIDEQKP